MFILITWCYKYTLQMSSTLFPVRLYSKSYMLQVGSCFNSFFFCSFLLCPIIRSFFSSPLPSKWFVYYSISIVTHQGDPLGGPFFTLVHFHAICSSTSLFLFCLFPFIVDDTHIITILVVFQVFHDLSSQFNKPCGSTP